MSAYAQETAAIEAQARRVAELRIRLEMSLDEIDREQARDDPDPDYLPGGKDYEDDRRMWDGEARS